MTCAVFFNLDGTLVDHELDYEHIYRKAVAGAGLEELEGSYGTYTDRFFRYFQNGWTFPRRQAILDIMQDQGIADLGRSDRFAEAWEDAEAAEADPLLGMQATIDALAGQYTLGIATNGTGRLQRMKLPNGDAFDVVLVSSEIGVSKPNAAFFEQAREAVDADRHVIVSDELRRDILPAKREDFLTVWISEESGNPQVEELVDRRVASLEEVAAAVDEVCG